MLSPRLFAVSLLLVALLSPGTVAARKYLLRTAPVEGGRILLDGVYVGDAPLDLKLRIKKGQVIELRAEKQATIAAWPVSLRRGQKGPIVLRLEPDETWGRGAEEPRANQWQRLLPASGGGRGPDDLWRRLLALIERDWDGEIERAERPRRYLRTAWSVRHFRYKTLRSRFVVKFGVGERSPLLVVLQSQWRPAGEALIAGELVPEFKPSQRVRPAEQRLLDALSEEL